MTCTVRLELGSMLHYNQARDTIGQQNWMGFLWKEFSAMGRCTAAVLLLLDFLLPSALSQPAAGRSQTKSASCWRAIIETNAESGID